VLVPLAIGVSVTAPSVAPAEIVGDPAGGTAFSTLSGAVAAAPAGSVIRIRPGVYPETVIIGKNLSLVGGGADQGVVLDGEGRRPLVCVASAVTCRFENLVFCNGLGEAGGAVQVSRGAVADFINCAFHDNAASLEGGAVALTDDGTWSEFVGCHFQRNRAAGRAGAVAILTGAEATLRRCTFFANRSDDVGGGVASFSHAPLVVEDCLFIENLGLECGAICVSDAPARIAGNTFFRNSSLDGASVFVHDDAGAHDLDVTNNIFASDLEGAGLRIPAGGRRGCNVYADNLAGPLLGAQPTAEELLVDPGFCDFRGLDLSLRRNSPASGRSSACGRIGALDVGCLEGLEATRDDGPGPRRRVH